ncbi:MAG: NAD(P)/FAD-dependent oxidoreductase, partial [Chloroflexota bacterium]|nr:NAD(P)/FAD-dependent oxidoreductase [Chloroflexota bacterium]
MASAWDAIVVGGGPAGSATALLLARAGRRVVLIDRARFPRRKPCAEYLSPGAVRMLDALGLDLGGRGRRLRGMQIVAPDGSACHLVDYRHPSGRLELGLAIERRILDAALLDLARASGVEVREGCRVASVHRQDHRVDGVWLSDGAQLSAPLVIGADGLHSVVARALGPAPPPAWPRRLGLVAHLRDVPWSEQYGQMRVGWRGYVGVAPVDQDGSVTVGVVCPLGQREPAALLFERALSEHPQLAERLRAGSVAEPIVGLGPLAKRVR